MPEKSFNYKEKSSDIFKKIKRPLIDIDIYSNLKNRWFTIEEVLADSGADISILPRYVGKILVDDITKGKQQEIRGVVPYTRLLAFIHTLKFRINGKEFSLPVAIAESDDVPPILGRVKGLDLFDAMFLKGKKVTFNWE